MADIEEAARAQLRRFYALTTQLRVQLEAFDSTVPRVQVEVREVDPPDDIEGVALLVLIEANRSEQEDLKAIMADVKAVTQAKAELHSLLEQQAERGLDLLSVSALITAAITRAESWRTVEEIESDLDSMREFGETESMRLQMAMDRFSKVMSTMSNIVKKMADTASVITQNMK